MRKTLRPAHSRRYPQLCISTVVGTPVASTSALRVFVTAMQLLAAVTLLPACGSAHAQSTRSRADRLRITAKRDQLSLEYGAVVTATGTVGVRGDADATTLPVDKYAGRVLLTARPRTRHCPRRAPRPDPPHSDFDDVNEARYTETLAIASAFEVARKLRLCGYLTAKRHTPSGVRTVTVARASTTLTGPVQQDSSEEPAWAYRVVGWIIAVTLFIGLIVALIVGLIKLVRWWIHDTPAARAARRAATLRRLRRLWLRSPAPPPAPPTPSYATPASPPPRPAPMAAPMRQPAPVQSERPRRRAKPRDVVLDAVDAVADTYRDRLQNILEHQDGPGWLDAFNQRRAASFSQDSRPAPRPYDSLEPRAVLTCLARDPAGLQLISEPTTIKARQLSGLVNDAVHPKPHAPLTEADGYRAWQLYTDITGIVPAGDPFDR
jgi:pyruvate/2-oxoglutarate dehydrogenase complex dihydrolipoamide acyltransferase (E2) component